MAPSAATSRTAEAISSAAEVWVGVQLGVEWVVRAAESKLGSQVRVRKVSVSRAARTELPRGGRVVDVAIAERVLLIHAVLQLREARGDVFEIFAGEHLEVAEGEGHDVG
eukprot:4400591-Prymnesium_polylepis.2